MPATPVVAPLYPDPPITYRGARMAVALFERPCPEGVLPPGLAPGAGAMTALVLADYPDTDIGPYREVIVLVAATAGEEAGFFCPLIYVTSDAALAAGREIWGFPKKMADISLEVEGDRVRGRLSRGGIDLAVLDGHAAVVADASASEGLAALPIYNHKRIPGVAGGPDDVDILTSVRLASTSSETRQGAAAVSTRGEVARFCGDTTDAPLVVSLADVVLPAGTVVSTPVPTAAGGAG